MPFDLTRLMDRVLFDPGTGVSSSGLTLDFEGEGLLLNPLFALTMTESLLFLGKRRGDAVKRNGIMHGLMLELFILLGLLRLFSNSDD